MTRFKTREYLPEYNGMKEVIKITHANGSVVYHTIESSFVNLANSLGANKLNVSDNEFGLYLHLFTLNNEAVGMYKMTPRLRGFSIQQLVDQHRRLFVYKVYNRDRKMWETYVDGRLVKADIYKEGCGLATILKDDKWSVIDGNNNEVVPSGKYDYIDGFDKCGLARVKINGKIHIFNPEKSTKDRWGVIDTEGNEVLPLVFSEIWAFYNKNRLTTTVWKGDKLIDLEDGTFYDYYQERVYKYDFVLKTRELRIKEDWSQGNYNCLDPNYNRDPSDDYSIWDALEGEVEAAGNIDYEW